MNDEQYYAIAAREIATKQVKEGLFAKAYAAALGDSERTKAIYIGLRAQQIQEEVAQLAIQTARNAAEDARLVEIRRQNHADIQKKRNAEEKHRAEEESRKLTAAAAEEKRLREAMAAERAGKAWNQNNDPWIWTQPEKSKEAPPAPPLPQISLEDQIKIMKAALEVSKNLK